MNEAGGFLLGMIAFLLMLTFVSPEWVGGKAGRFVAAYHAAATR